MKITFRDVTPCSFVTILQTFWGGETSACISKISVNVLPDYTASDNLQSNRASGRMEMFVNS